MVHEKSSPKIIKVSRPFRRYLCEHRVKSKTSEMFSFGTGLISLAIISLSTVELNFELSIVKRSL